MNVDELAQALSARWLALPAGTLLRGVALLVSGSDGGLRLDITAFGMPYVVPVPLDPENPGHRCGRCGAIGAHDCTRTDLDGQHWCFATADDAAAALNAAFLLAERTAAGTATDADRGAVEAHSDGKAPFADRQFAAVFEGRVP